MSVLARPYFHDEAAAFAHLESVLWPNGPVCPHCGSVNAKHYDLRKTRIGLRKCCEKECRKQFTVRVGTVFESSHIPLHKIMQAVYLMTSSKKGISAHQLHRVLEITYKAAWFLAHRIREAMRVEDPEPLGGKGKTVEVDETFIGVENDYLSESRERTEHGSIEGTLVDVGTDYNKPALKIIERKSGRQILCRVEQSVIEEIAKKADFRDVWSHRRVSIRGQIAFDASGQIVRVYAKTITPMSPRTMTLHDVEDRDFTGKLSTEEYVERLREGDLGGEA